MLTEDDARPASWGIHNDSLDDRRRRIALLMEAEDDFVQTAVILIAERGEVLVEIRFEAGDGLENRDARKELGRQRARPSRELSQGARRRREVDRSDDGQSEEEQRNAQHDASSIIRFSVPSRQAGSLRLHRPATSSDPHSVARVAPDR
jgi:hypothetical protein